MRWTLFKRRSKRDEAVRTSSGDVNPSVVAVSDPVVTRAAVTTSALAQHAQLRDMALRFARDYLLASGAKVRVEGPDLLSATQADGQQTQYTSSLNRARSGVSTELLAPGGPALAAMVADVEQRAGVSALRLPEAHDAREILRRLAPTLIGAPVRADTFVIEQAEDALSIECAFEVHARWRGGASHEWITLSLDARTLAAEHEVDEEALKRATAMPLPTGAAALFERAFAAAEASLAPTLAAVGRWLRLRSANEYATRQDDLLQTAERLAREAPEDARGRQLTFEREAQRLRDLFAVAVDASLTRVAVVTSPVCVARPKDSSRGPALRIDLGRGTLRILDDSPRDATRTPAASDPGASPLTADDLLLLPANTWREAVVWLLERMGYAVARVVESPSALRAETQRDGRAATVIAMRREAGAAIQAADARDALAGDQTTRAERLLLTPSALGDDARSVLARVGVTLIDRDALSQELLRQGNAYADLRAATTEQSETLARQTGDVRDWVIGCVEDLEAVLVQSANTRRATGSEIAKAAAVLREVWTVSDQVFVAWETLLADWQALFPERAARDGSMRLLGDEARLNELRERAEHLVGVTRGGFARLADAPDVGEMGYTTWRRALLEELTARCETLRWRIQATDPTQWRDFARVTDAQALERAETARTSALHARARAEKAYAQLAARARL